jgi:hypothetical protein
MISTTYESLDVNQTLLHRMQSTRGAHANLVPVITTFAKGKPVVKSAATPVHLVLLTHILK